MEIRILGVKGEIEESKPQHRKESGIMLNGILVDLGKGHNFEELKIKYIVVTHGHPDHIEGFKGREIDVPVYCSLETQILLRRQGTILKEWKRISHGSRFDLDDFSFRAFDTIHSLKAPSLAFKIIHRDGNIGITSDIITIEDRKVFFRNLDVVIADGSFMERGMIRRKDKKIYGHCALKDIFRWCDNFGISQVIVQHYGAWYMKKFNKEKLKQIERGLTVFYARDGSTYNLKNGVLGEVAR